MVKLFVFLESPLNPSPNCDVVVFQRHFGGKTRTYYVVGYFPEGKPADDQVTAIKIMIAVIEAHKALFQEMCQPGLKVFKEEWLNPANWVHLAGYHPLACFYDPSDGFTTNLPQRTSDVYDMLHERVYSTDFCYHMLN